MLFYIVMMDNKSNTDDSHPDSLENYLKLAKIVSS